MTKNKARVFAKEVWKEFLSNKKLYSQILFHLKFFLSNRNIERVLITLPMKEELNYLGVIEKLKLTSYAPITYVAGRMEFFLFHKNGKQVSGIQLGYYSVPGPDSEIHPIKKPLTKDDVIIIPALATNGCGYRLGRGGGYFDRYFAKNSFGGNIKTHENSENLHGKNKKELIGGVKVSLVPKALLRLPFQEEGHDLRLDYVITEDGVEVLSI